MQKLLHQFFIFQVLASVPPWPEPQLFAVLSLVVCYLTHSLAHTHTKISRDNFPKIYSNCQATIISHTYLKNDPCSPLCLSLNTSPCHGKCLSVTGDMSVCHSNMPCWAPSLVFTVRRVYTPGSTSCLTCTASSC